MTESLNKTPLHAWHAANGGRLVDFAGWSMPVQYGSIIDEHVQTRTAAGLFDVSHMGRLYFEDAAAALAALEKICTRRMAGLLPGQIRYSLITDDAGYVLDDVLVYHLIGEDETPFVMMVVNASNRQKIVDWLRSHWPQNLLPPWDRTTETAMIAVQGPFANELVSQLSDLDPSEIKYYTGRSSNVAGYSAIVTRTGYTGEDGCELIVAAEAAEEIWTALVTAGGGACGLASRDTLRLEAAMPLYGHELTEEINAAQTGLKFAINLKERTFPGRDAIAAARSNKTLPVRVGLQLDGKRAAREGCSIIVDGQAVGFTTSGTFGPTVERSISMGYLDRAHATPGTEVAIDIRGKQVMAQVVQLPFYKRK